MMLMLTYTGRVNLEEEIQQQRESEKSGQVTVNRRSIRSLVNGRIARVIKTGEK